MEAEVIIILGQNPNQSSTYANSFTKAKTNGAIIVVLLIHPPETGLMGFNNPQK